MSAVPASAAAWSHADRPSRAAQPLAKSSVFNVEKNSVTDPTGDTFGVGEVEIDITAFSVEAEDGNLVFHVTFAEAVSAPGSGEPNELFGYVDIDADQDGNTGDVPWTDVLVGSEVTGMGNEYYVDLETYDATSGEAEVVDDNTEIVVGAAAVTVDGTSLWIEIPLSVLGNDEGSVNAAAVLGTTLEPTDIVPNNGSVASVSNTILLNDGRFRVTVDWRRPPEFPDSQPAFVSDLTTDDSAIFYFLTPDNLELLLKVLNACSSPTPRYWVFFAAATDVEFTVTVTDTLHDETQVYTNELNHPADAVTDTNAFATCP